VSIQQRTVRQRLASDRELRGKLAAIEQRLRAKR
jgi:hypothetical protein